jgi:hypothetical protein
MPNREFSVAVVIALVMGSILLFWPRDAEGQADGWAALTDGAVVLFRHASAPGGGDPIRFRAE